MPALAYSFEMVAGDTVARFVSVDAISIHDDKNCGERGLAEISGHVTSPDQSQARACCSCWTRSWRGRGRYCTVLYCTVLYWAGQGAWRLVFGHYPLYSGGHYYGSNTMRRLMEDILEDNKVTSELTLS